MGTILNEDALIFNADDSIERNIKEKEYLDYINTHRENVKIAFKRYFLPLLDNDKTFNTILFSDSDFRDSIIRVQELIPLHDQSKFSDDEFDGYRAKWYPTKQEELDEDFQKSVLFRYEECWKHHYKNNPHHPEYWVSEETGEPRDMILDAIIEMICDWEAVSMYFASSTTDWYENKAVEEKKAMTSNTKQITEFILYNILHS